MEKYTANGLLAERSTWDRGVISKLAAISAPLETKTVALIRQLLGPQYNVSLHSNTFYRHDLVIEIDGKNDFKVELEFGTHKAESYWTDKIPDRWHRGCSVVSRKVEEDGKHYDLFIKFSSTLESFFATTLEYAQRCVIKTCRHCNAPVDIKRDENGRYTNIASSFHTCPVLQRNVDYTDTTNLISKGQFAENPQGTYVQFNTCETYFEINHKAPHDPLDFCFDDFELLREMILHHYLKKKA